MEDRFLFRGKRIDNGEWVESCKMKGVEIILKKLEIQK